MKKEEIKQEEEGQRKLSDGETGDKKRERVPIYQSRNILTVDTPPGKVDRWVLDYPKGKVRRFLDAGYEFVVDESLPVGDESIDGTRAPGNVVSKMGNPKTGDMLYLMRIDKEIYEEDQRAKQLLVDESENELHRKVNRPGYYGSLSIKGKGGVKQPE